MPQDRKSTPKAEQTNMDGLDVNSPLWEDPHAPGPFHAPEADPARATLRDALIVIIAILLLAGAALAVATFRGS